MKALTISPPWGFAIFHLGKDVENRVWAPSPSELKPGDWFLVHGGRSPLTGKGVVQETEYGSNFRMSVRQLCADITSDAFPLTLEQTTYLLSLGKPREKGGHLFDWSTFHLPGIIGAVEFLGCSQAHQSYWAMRGQYHWLLGRRVLFPEPIPCRGALKLWDVPQELHQQARDQYKQAMKELVAK